jgi:predicted short-subunit dehydrogenase-like oxidoreductase (DUF2520 family)
MGWKRISFADTLVHLPMKPKPVIAIVGAGNLANALAVSLCRAGYKIEAVVARSNVTSRARARKLAREVGARPRTAWPRDLRAGVVWFCVPDGEVRRAAQAIADKMDWMGRVALHSSGALTSGELGVLRQRGAAVGSVHPLMTFVRGSRQQLTGVPFAIEGDARAVRVARQLVKDLDARSFPIRKQQKALYHAWGTFASPLFTALLATAEQVAGAAGVPQSQARARVIPILRQTLENYAAFGPATGFSGPIIRGDVETVVRHWRVLRRIPAAREVYRALLLAALRYLPAKNQAQLRRAVRA